MGNDESRARSAASSVLARSTMAWRTRSVKSVTAVTAATATMSAAAMSRSSPERHSRLKVLNECWRAGMAGRL